MKLKKGDLVYVEWWDHSSFHENRWRDHGDIADLAPLFAKSVGWVLSDNGKQLIIAAHCNDEYELAQGEMAIVKGAIKQVKRIKVTP